MGAIESTGASITVTITDNTIIPSSDVKIVTLGGTTGEWTLETDDKYLTWSSGNTLNLGTAAKTWTISIATDGTATIAFVDDATRKLQYNAGSPRFACYTSEQTDIALYKHEHVWENGTCTQCDDVCEHSTWEDSACSACGKICESHTWENGECTVCDKVCEHIEYENGVCKVCGEQEPTHECVFEGEGMVTTEPTCTTEGERTWTCTVEGCDETKTEEIPALGHSYTDVTVEPTCTEKGSTTSTCSKCDSVITEDIPALGHTYVNEICSVCHEFKVEYVLVTDISTLKAGDKVVIAAADSDVALSTTQNSNNRGQVAITKDGNTIISNDNVQVITLEAGKKDGTFAFNTGSGYLYAASSSSNHLKTETTLSDNSSWTIEIADSGVATIKAQGTNTRNWLRYNSKNSIFSCYGDGQADIVLYKQVDLNTIEECSTEASFKLTYQKDENNQYVKDGTHYILESVKLRFGMTLDKDLGAKLLDLDGKCNVEVTLGENIIDCWNEGQVPVLDESTGKYMLAALIAVPEANWGDELTAKMYVEIGGVKYYMEEVVCSVNSLAEEYLQTETDEEAIYTLNILAGTVAEVE